MFPGAVNKKVGIQILIHTHRWSELSTEEFVDHSVVSIWKLMIFADFQLAFAPRYFDAERATWKLVIQLNLIRYVWVELCWSHAQVTPDSNIRTIIETLKIEWDPATPTTPVDMGSAIRTFRRVRLGLSPLFIVETNLMRMLAPETKDPTKDVCVRAGSGWKALLRAQRSGQSSSAPVSPREGRPAGAHGLGGRIQSHASLHGESDPGQVLIAQREEILWLWKDPEVRSVLKKHRVQLEEAAGL